MSWLTQNQIILIQPTVQTKYTSESHPLNFNPSLALFDYQRNTHKSAHFILYSDN